MKRYMENIGHESFRDYQSLSKEYYNSIQVYHELKYPSRIVPSGRFMPRQDIQADLYRIEEQFKARALGIACEKHGYKDPGYGNYDKDLTEKQENGSYGNPYKDNFDLTPEDLRAEKAHAAFEKEYPDRIVDRELNRGVIEEFFNGLEGPKQTRQESPAKDAEQKQQTKQEKKEPFSREELKHAFDANKEDITNAPKKSSMSSRFFMSLPSERPTPEGPDDPGWGNMSKDRGDIEMEMDR